MTPPFSPSLHGTQAVALYRKRDPESADETECLENVFLCLCTALLQVRTRPVRVIDGCVVHCLRMKVTHTPSLRTPTACVCVCWQPENQDKFLACEGMELLVRCLKEGKQAAAGALKAVKYATSNYHRGCCEALVAAGGLKYVFPALMGRGAGAGAGSKKKPVDGGAGREAEEAAVAVVSQLVGRLHDCEKDDMGARLLLKLTENEGEKLDRCSELFVK